MEIDLNVGYVSKNKKHLTGLQIPKPSSFILNSKKKETK